MAKGTRPVKKKSPVVKKKTPVAKKATKSPAKSSPEYREYLDRYAFLGEDRPKLSFDEFEKLDDELLDLLAMNRLDDDQAIRKQELEYLLIDSEE
jgi:hypothetical protein